MERTPQRHPLDWPEAFPRTKPFDRSSSWKFKKTTFGNAVVAIVEQLRLMGIYEEDIVISSNVPVRLDGLPYANRKATSQDPGVAVYWRDEDGDPLSMACDTYDTVKGNIRGLALTLKAFRDIERHGSSDLLKRAFQGFKALPSAIPMGGERHWREVLGAEPGDSLETVRQMYHELIAEAHPDKGGNPDRAAEINVAWTKARQVLS